jgi:glutaredoxin
MLPPRCRDSSLSTLLPSQVVRHPGLAGIPFVQKGKRTRRPTAATPTVTIYSLTTCGWSAKAKAFFRARGISPLIIEYDMADSDLQAKISAEMRGHGAQGFPFVKIGGHVVPGYSPADYERLLTDG